MSSSDANCEPRQLSRVMSMSTFSVTVKVDTGAITELVLDDDGVWVKGDFSIAWKVSSKSSSFVLAFVLVVEVD